MLLTLALGAALAGVVASAGVVQEAEAASPERIVFASDRARGPGVNNPTGDDEIFRMNPDGTGVKQLTANAGDDHNPTLSPDGTKVVYESYGKQPSNPEGDREVYLMNSLDGSGKKNLSNNGTDVNDRDPVFSPRGKRIAFSSSGVQTSNPEGDGEVYLVNADGSGNKNSTDNALGIQDYSPAFSPDGRRIAYTSYGKQTSNPEGDEDVYSMNVLGGLDKKNLSNNGGGVNDIYPVFSPDSQKIAFSSSGVQTSNPEGDTEVYLMNANGSDQSNFTFTSGSVQDYSPVFSPGGQKVVYESTGAQTSNPEGDTEIYLRNANGPGEINLTNNGTGVQDSRPVFSPDGMKIGYESYGKQPSNPEGELEIYRMGALDGSGKKNLTNNPVALDAAYPDMD